MDTVPKSRELRQFPRQSLEAGYTAVRIRRSGRQRYSLRGHAYDISAGGLRIELDKALTPGERVDVEVELPSQAEAPRRRIVAAGRVVRFDDPELPGPVRMGLSFTAVEDREALTDYIRRAA